MIDRTELDLRYAAHAARTARINREGWQRTDATPRSCAVLATTLTAGLKRLMHPPQTATGTAIRADQHSA